MQVEPAPDATPAQRDRVGIHGSEGALSLGEVHSGKDILQPVFERFGIFSE
jgi:hypothetical protein